MCITVGVIPAEETPLAKKRASIQMSDEEVREFLGATQTLILTSLGPDGFPHSVPMWFALDGDGTIRITTFGKSQKVLNIRRNPKVTLLAESGEKYPELKGVMIQAEAKVVEDVELAIDTILQVAGSDPMVAEASAREAMREGVRRTAEKRVVIVCAPSRTISFDHRKLGGAY